MSSNDHPETGSNQNDFHESPAATSPQEPQPQQTNASESTTAHPTETTTATESTSAPLASDNAQSADAAIATHTAGGESVTPVTAMTSSLTTPANEAATTIAQPQDPASPPMNTEEPKQAVEVSSEQSDEAEGKEEDAGPSLDITLLLTTGSRHPFTINGKYLRKRSVSVENNDPFTMSVYTLKELIWREWRADWEARPSSPSSIRLISFGKLLDDKSPLSESKFNHDAPNVVHMTVKPQEVVDEEDAKGAKAQYDREGENNERSPGCRCVIM
ncbi:hypothetical protein N7478_005046 [Penicillium angulare]|uniref:uncharacterized protein n=1 Tax=Penicillium angulare TaxID=116970 RepID=UPI00254154E3|nr:uncharacterized protein N7478_005046 [Penicillium angulare]KAJ5279674.1 hypothetical protein N7478_005046 [Penicillium angulare]